MVTGSGRDVIVTSTWHSVILTFLSGHTFSACFKHLDPIMKYITEILFILMQASHIADVDSRWPHECKNINFVRSWSRTWLRSHKQPIYTRSKHDANDGHTIAQEPHTNETRTPQEDITNLLKERQRSTGWISVKRLYYIVPTCAYMYNGKNYGTTPVNQLNAISQTSL